MSVDDVLRDHGWNPDEVAKALQDSLAREPQSTLASSGADGDFLDRYAGVSRATPVARRLQVLHHAILRSSEVTSSLRSKEVAELLGCSPSRVSHRYKEGSLYGFHPRGAQILFPDWQFDGAQTIPHLGAVIAALDPDAPAVLVRRFMEQATDNLDIEGPISPRDWLLAGGDPAPVLQTAPHLGDQV